MSIKETIYQTLQTIAETYIDTVPEDNTTLPVIRFYHISSVPSLTGDDRPISKSHSYQIDLYTQTHDENLILSIENALFSMDLSIFLNQINESKEEDVIRTSFNISIEE
ncbi:hypothetical protein ABEX78_32315 [Priestia megaterium]